jgi:maleamate amidohydrolase
MKEHHMSEPIWNKFLTERDKEVFAYSGYGARGGFGKRPALLVIDVNYAFCGDKPEPILESIKKWRNSCGEESWPAVAAIKTLIDKAHEKELPVLYTTGIRRDDNWDSGSWSWKNSRGAEKPKVAASNVEGNQIVEDIAPGPRHRHLQAKAVGLFRHQHGELPDVARLRFRDRDGDDDVGLRARHGA